MRGLWIILSCDVVKKKVIKKTPREKSGFVTLCQTGNTQYFMMTRVSFSIDENTCAI